MNSIKAASLLATPPWRNETQGLANENTKAKTKDELIVGDKNQTASHATLSCPVRLNLLNVGIVMRPDIP